MIKTELVISHSSKGEIHMLTFFVTLVISAIVTLCLIVSLRVKPRCRHCGSTNTTCNFPNNPPSIIIFDAEVEVEITCQDCGFENHEFITITEYGVFLI